MSGHTGISGGVAGATAALGFAIVFELVYEPAITLAERMAGGPPTYL